jgi:hypothetical protein
MYNTIIFSETVHAMNNYVLVLATLGFVNIDI